MLLILYGFLLIFSSDMSAKSVILQDIVPQTLRNLKLGLSTQLKV